MIDVIERRISLRQYALFLLIICFTCRRQLDVNASGLHRGRVAVLVQGRADEMSQWFHVFNATADMGKHARLFILSYDKQIDSEICPGASEANTFGSKIGQGGGSEDLVSCVFDPGSLSWAGGRNRLAREVYRYEQETHQEFKYWLFADADRLNVTCKAASETKTPIESRRSLLASLFKPGSSASIPKRPDSTINTKEAPSNKPTSSPSNAMVTTSTPPESQVVQNSGKEGNVETSAISSTDVFRHASICYDRFIHFLLARTSFAQVFLMEMLADELEVRRYDCGDSTLHAIHRAAAPILLPYTQKLDEYSWEESQKIQYRVIIGCIPHSGIGSGMLAKGQITESHYQHRRGSKLDLRSEAINKIYGPLHLTPFPIDNSTHDTQQGACVDDSPIYKNSTLKLNGLHQFKVSIHHTNTSASWRFDHPVYHKCLKALKPRFLAFMENEVMDPTI